MDRSPSSPTIRSSEKLPSSSQPASTRPRSISSQLTGCPLPWALALPPTSLSATIRYYHYTKLQKPQAAKGRSPSSSLDPMLVLHPLSCVVYRPTQNLVGYTGQRRGLEPSTMLRPRHTLGYLLYSCAFACSATCL